MSNNSELNLGKVVIGAFLIPWSRRNQLARGLALPVLGFAALFLLMWQLGSEMSSIGSWLLSAIYVGLFTLFAVACHRVALLGTTENTAVFKRQWSGRETRFIGWVIGVYGLFLLLTLIVITVGGTITLTLLPRAFLERKEYIGWYQLVTLVGAAPAAYVFARLSLVFPATAIDQKVDMAWAWERSRNNGWRLAVVVCALPWIVSFLIGTIDWESLPVAGWLLTPVIWIITGLIAIWEITVLSLSYQELKDQKR